MGLYREFLKEVNPKSILFDDNRLLYLLNLPRNFQIPNDWPIYQVSFYEALEFCNWLSIRDGFDPVYTIEYLSKKEVNVEWDVNKNGYRLPTEAEWEYAASGGGKDKNILSGDEKVLDEYAWLSFNYGRSIHSVGLKKPNIFGLYDVLGNVSEWCWDLYDIDYYKKGITNNPRGPEVGNNPNPYYLEYKEHRVTDRVIRGLSVTSSMADTYSRAGMQPFPAVLFIIGFRVARN